MLKNFEMVCKKNIFYIFFADFFSSANFSANMYNAMPDGQNVQNQMQNAVDGVADESEIEKQMQNIADGVLKERPAEMAKK